jgi:hypothetical protein
VNYTRFLLAAALVLATAGVAHANAVDPGIVVVPPGDATSVGTMWTVSTLGGDHTFHLVNNLAGTSDYISLLLLVTVTVPEPTGSTFTCDGGTFFTDPCIATVPALPSTGPFEFLFSGGPGIPVGTFFDLSISGWGLDPNVTTIQGIAGVPEPATMALMLLGVGAVALRRKLVSS